MIGPFDPVWIPFLFPLPALGFLVWWYLFMAYPIFLERQIRKGKNWVYVPLNWKNARKTWVHLSSWLFRLLAASFLAWSCTLVFGIGWLMAPLGAVAWVLIELFGKWLERIRYNQQEALYFQRLTIILRRYEEQGRRNSEQEARNLCSWHHQQQLREADQKGLLLKVLVGKASVSMHSDEQPEEGSDPIPAEPA
jgi:hypothetical protein